MSAGPPRLGSTTMITNTPRPSDTPEMLNARLNRNNKETLFPILSTQVGGTHYTDMKIQPIEFILANGIPFPEGSVIKYVSRWRAKGGVKDLKKAQHFLSLLIEFETANPSTAA